MAFTRSFLKALGIEDEKIEAIMGEHVAVTDAIKKQRDDYKAEADKAADLQKKLDEAQGGDDYKKKFEDEHAAFEDFKKKTAAEAEAAKVQAAYRKLLIEEKVGEKRLDSVMKVTDFSNMKLDKDGNLVDADKLKESIKADWADFITEKKEKGADVPTPPDQDKNTFETMSLGEKMAYANLHPTDPSVAAWLNK